MRYVRQILDTYPRAPAVDAVLLAAPSKRPATALRPAPPTPTLTWASRTWPRS